MKNIMLCAASAAFLIGCDSLASRDDTTIEGWRANTILGGGAMPLAILERRVDDWVASVKAS